MWNQIRDSVIIILFCLSTVLAKNRKFPDNFQFGTGTSAFQIEGGWNEDGKTESILDLVFNEPDTNDTSNDIGARTTCDSYHKWQEDIKVMKELGTDFYRFSISWNRILPNGTDDYINQKGVDYYLNILKALKANNIQPKVTIYHVDEPAVLFFKGGWQNPDMVDYFGNYTRVLYRLFGPYVKHWFTINEPKEVCKSASYLDPNNEGEKIYICSRHLILAHARAYHIYDQEFRATQNGKVSMVINSEFYKPLHRNNADDVKAAERELQFEFNWFANCLYTGDWPKQMKTRIAERSKMEGYNHSRLPEWSKEEKKYIIGTLDFFSLNNYRTFLVTDGVEASVNDSATFESDKRVQNSLGANWTCSPISDTNCIRPEGIRGLLRRIHHLYHPSEIIITENGWVDQGGLEDPLRIEYLRSYLGAVLDAIYIDKIPVTGYAVWSLLDNFEFFSNYTLKYGIIDVNFTDPERPRTLKLSAKWYRDVISTRRLN